MSGSEQTRKSWRYPGDKLNRNLLGRSSGLAPTPRHRHRVDSLSSRRGRPTRPARAGAADAIVSPRVPHLQSLLM